MTDRLRSMHSSEAVDYVTSVLDALPDATAVVDRSAVIVTANRTWRGLAGTRGKLPDLISPGLDYLDLCDRAAAAGYDDARRVALALRSVLAGQSTHSEIEYSCQAPGSATCRWFLLRITPLHGEIPGAVLCQTEITRRKMAVESLRHQASHDALTGLANRGRFTSRLQKALTPRAGRRVKDVGVLYLDLDGFKRVNDTYGHGAGDEVLLSVSERLKSVVRPQDTVARLGGDEFAVLSTRIDESGLADLAGRIDDALALPYLVYGKVVEVPASVGFHLAAAGEMVSDVLRQADQAMYAAKRA